VFLDGAVEGLRVALALGLVERPLVAVADVGERLGAVLDEIDVLAVALLGLVAVGLVVAAFRLVAGDDQVGVLAPEQLELALDHVGEAGAAETHASSR
jgi:hypothetical protein